MKREDRRLNNINDSLKPVSVCQPTKYVLILETNLLKAFYGNSRNLL